MLLGFLNVDAQLLQICIVSEQFLSLSPSIRYHFLETYSRALLLYHFVIQSKDLNTELKQSLSSCRLCDRQSSLC